jgi:hypothetical protein
MLKSERTYYLACISLWCFLTLRTEEIGSWESLPFYRKWDEHYSEITNWAFQEQDYVRDKLLESEKIDFTHVAEELCNSLVVTSLNTLREAAKCAHKTYLKFSEDLWLYYYYAQSLKEVLTEFEKLIKAEAKPYDERYEDNQGLFNDLHKILEQEYPSLDIESIVTDLDFFAFQLGKGWHEAVLATVQNI